MLTIDSQVHAYERNSPQRPWLSTPDWPASANADEMVAAMDAVGVDGAINISPFSLYGYDASYALEACKKYPTRLALIKPVDAGDPAVAETIADWKAQKGTVGVRLMLRELSKDPADPGFTRTFAAAAKHNMPVNILAWGRLEQTEQMIARNPDAVIVIDHLGLQQPHKMPPPKDVWADLPIVLRIAKHANVKIKISGACTMSHEPFPYKDIWDPLARMFDAYGLDRCMWGTDWTRAAAVLPYKPAVDAFRVTDRLSESDRARLMGESLTKIYNWTPSKAKA